MTEIITAIIVGVITGAFTAGTIYGMLKTELRFLRRDVDHVLKKFDQLEDRRTNNGH